LDNRYGTKTEQINWTQNNLDKEQTNILTDKQVDITQCRYVSLNNRRKKGLKKAE